ncbi:MAG: DUF3378 domain-containing protein [Holdemania massiliensis]
MNTITLLLTLPQIERLYEVWREFEVKAPAYSRYQLKPENCTITAYQSNKVVFQGKMPPSMLPVSNGGKL